MCIGATLAVGNLNGGIVLWGAVGATDTYEFVGGRHTCVAIPSVGLRVQMGDDVCKSLGCA